MLGERIGRPGEGNGWVERFCGFLARGEFQWTCNDEWWHMLCETTAKFIDIVVASADGPPRS